MEAAQPFRKVVAFFVIAFVISWLLWLPQVLDSNGVVQFPESVGILGMFAPFGPFIAALWLTGRQGGLAGVKKLLRRGWDLDFDKRWLVPTVFLIPAANLVTVVVMTLMGLPIQWEFAKAWPDLVPTFVMILLFNALPEEYGWRGYALGPMLKRSNALAASLILGLLWGLWHLPLHFIEGTVQAAIPMYEFVPQQMVLAVLYTWLFKNTGGVVSVAILFHSVGNIMGAAVPYWTTDMGRWIGFAVLVVFAVVILLIWGPQNLSRAPLGSHDPAPVECWPDKDP
jgi:membrane protease YdiL (CAAX protease family)